MSRVVLTCVAVLMTYLPVQAQDETKPNSPKAERRSTFASVRALANTAGPVITDPDRQADRAPTNDVRGVADKAKEKSPDAAEAPKPREPKPGARKDVRGKAPVENDRKPAAELAKKQAQRRPQNDWARQQGGIGFQPWIGDPWVGGWGNAGWGNGFSSNQIAGYRSFRYSGYGNGYGWPYYYPGNGYGYGYGFGFSPVMPTISGPVTTRYADPVGRQHKMMDESIRRFAEGK